MQEVHLLFRAERPIRALSYWFGTLLMTQLYGAATLATLLQETYQGQIKELERRACSMQERLEVGNSIFTAVERPSQTLSVLADEQVPRIVPCFVHPN